MIGRINGKLLEKQAPELLVDVQGVGYEILVSMNTFFSLPGIGDPVVLHTHFVVREDAQQLFGFATLEERHLFRNLVKVNGVGPKMALAILSGMSVTDFIQCIRSGDVVALTRAPGVGKKTAERLVVEMKDKLSGWETTESVAVSTVDSGPSINQILEEAESALIALGYKPQEAAKMVVRANRELGGDATSEALIRASLKSTVK